MDVVTRECMHRAGETQVLIGLTRFMYGMILDSCVMEKTGIGFGASYGFIVDVFDM